MGGRHSYAWRDGHLLAVRTEVVWLRTAAPAWKADGTPLSSIATASDAILVLPGPPKSIKRKSRDLSHIVQLDSEDRLDRF
jgi:hypothetical protein